MLFQDIILNEGGQGSSEYSLTLAIVVVIVIAGISVLSGFWQGIFEAVATTLAGT
jgi:Flp pilus assembly pilin Flp